MHGYEVMGWLDTADGHDTNVSALCTNIGVMGGVQTLMSDALMWLRCLGPVGAAISQERKT